MSLFAPLTAWLLSGARTVSLTAPAEIPLELVPLDPRPVIAASVHDRPYLVHIDASGTSRIGRLAAIRLGLVVRNDRTTFDVQVGPLTIEHMRAEVVHGDEVVLGLVGLTQVSTTISASRGLLLVQRHGDASPLVDPKPASIVNGHRVLADGSSLGAQAMASTDVRCEDEGCSLIPVRSWTTQPARIDLRMEVTAARSRTRADDWEIPPAPEVSMPQGHPGSGWQSDRWLDVAQAYWQAGQLEDALTSTKYAVWAGGDRCEPWMNWGERLLRTEHTEEALMALTHSVAQLDAWERKVTGYTLEQPESCRSARSLLDEARLATHATPTLATAIARTHLLQGEPAIASRVLREDLHDQPLLDPYRLGLLGLADAQIGRSLPAHAALKSLAQHPEAQTLSAALLGARIAAHLSPEDHGDALLVAAAAGPVWRVVADFLAGRRSTEDLDASLALRPADPSLWAAAALQGRPVPTFIAPSADAVWADLLWAQRRTHPDGVHAAWRLLQQRWPLEAVGGIVTRMESTEDGLNNLRSAP